jgi:osmotically inducible lipoprotein OsmB
MKLIFRGTVLSLCLTLLLGGCAGMSNTEQRVLSGGSIGAGSGLLLGGLPGAVVGGGAGALGGYLYDKHQESEGKP